MAEILVDEIGRRVAGDAGGAGAGGAAVAAPFSAHREGYALAAGAALGLVVLGSGRSAPGVADLRLEDRLRCVRAPIHRHRHSEIRSLLLQCSGLGAAARVATLCLEARSSWVRVQEVKGWKPVPPAPHSWQHAGPAPQAP